MIRQLGRAAPKSEQITVLIVTDSAYKINSSCRCDEGPCDPEAREVFSPLGEGEHHRHRHFLNIGGKIRGAGLGAGVSQRSAGSQPR